MLLLGPRRRTRILHHGILLQLQHSDLATHILIAVPFASKHRSAAGSLPEIQSHQPLSAYSRQLCIARSVLILLGRRL